MKGWVHVIAGPMFSGKTEALLRQVRRYDIARKNVMVFRPEVDTRTGLVVSRSGAAYPGTVVNSATSVLHIAIAGLLDVVAIDEAQFFGGDLPEVVNELASDHLKHVIVSGLDRDFAGRGFGPVPDLLTIADEVTKLTAICNRCGDEAPLTQRLIDGRAARYDDPLVVIGGIGDETYEARCRKHHEVAG